MGVQKQAEFEQFIIWAIVPRYLRLKKAEELESLGFDPELIPLIQCKTQGQVAKFLKVTQETLSHWKKHPDYSDRIAKASTELYRNTFKAAIDAKFSERVAKNPTPYAVKTWHEIYAGFIPKQEVSGGITVVMDIPGPEGANAPKDKGKDEARGDNATGLKF